MHVAILVIPSVVSWEYIYIVSLNTLYFLMPYVIHCVEGNLIITTCYITQHLPHALHRLNILFCLKQEIFTSHIYLKFCHLIGEFL